MKVQPDPCPFINVLCREVSIQTKTRDTLQWVRRCLSCGREVVQTGYTFGEVKDIENAIAIHDQKSETYSDAAKRWAAQEVTGYKSRRRQRHAAAKGKQ